MTDIEARKMNGMQSDSSGDEDVEKDEKEIELEKLIFGDDAGFRDRVRLYGGSNVHLDSKPLLDKGAGLLEETEENDDFQDLDDADVRLILPCILNWTDILTFS